MRQMVAITTRAVSPTGWRSVVKPGMTYGETDEVGYNVAKDPVHVHDFQATVMHLMGIDHERLTYKYQDVDFD